MTERRRIDPSRVAGALMTEHCDIPEGMTVREWRRTEHAQRRAAKTQAGPVRRGLRRVLRRAA